MKGKYFSKLTATLCIIILIATTGCFRYERKYTKDLEIYTPPQPPSFPMQWAVGPGGSRAHQLTLKIVQSEEMDITPFVTKGSLESLEKIATGKTLLATVRADHAYLSYQGNNQQVRTDATRVISALNPLTVHILLKKDLGEEVSLNSLPSGSSIITDPLWEGGSFIARQVLRSCGRDPDQFEYKEIPLSEWDDTVQQQSIAAAILAVPIGDRKVSKILEQGIYQLSSIPLENIGMLIEHQPYFLYSKISEGKYPNQRGGVQTVLLKNLLLVRVDVTAEKVEKLCEVFFTCYRNYCLTEQKALGLARALAGVSVPIHQGALQFFRSRFELFTGDPLGTYYYLGLQLGGFCNRFLGPLILPRKSSGSVENINDIEKLYGQLALVQSDIAYKALTKKTLIVPEAPHLRTVAAFSPENLHIVAKKKSGIKTLSDLVGKKISLGELGSGTMLNAVEILKAAGIYDRLRKEDILFLRRTQLLPALQQGTVECFFQMTVDPSDFLTTLFKSGDYHFLKLPQDLINGLVSDFPYYVPGTIPSGYYPYQNSPTVTISTIALLVTHRDADPELIKKIVTVLGEHIQELSASLPQMKDLELSQLWTRSSIPFHPAVLSVVSQKRWPLKQPAVSYEESTETQPKESPYASGSTLSREEMKALIYPEEKIITEEAIDKDSTYILQERERRFMSLQEATLVALRENLSIAIEANTPLLRQLDIAIEKAQFYPHLLVDAERSVRRIKDTSRSDTTAVEAAIEERLPSGATIKIGSDWITWDDMKVSRSYDFSSFFEMTQPLLEGAGLEVNLADYYISRENSEISLESFRDRIISTLTETRTQYYTVLRAFQIFNILKQTLELSKQQLRRTAALVKVGKITEDQLTIAESNVSRREDDVIVARKNFRDQEDILLELLHAEYGYSVEPILQLPIREREFIPIEPYAEDLMRVALTKRPDVRTALTTIEVAAIEERVARNAVLPNVDLKAGVFNDSQVWDHSYQTFNAFEDYNDITFTLGLSLDLPVPNTEDRSAFVQSQIERRRRVQELQQLKETVQKEVRESMRRVNSAQERVVITKKALTDAEVQFAQEILKFRDGKTDNFNVFSTLGDFTVARLSELNSLVDYYQAVISQDRVLGVTDDRLKIHVYDTLSTHTRFSDAYNRSEQKELKMRK
jgi:TRAP transporter TAXI family solute receptor